MFEKVAIVVLGWLAGVLVNYLADILPVKRRPARPVCTACFEPQPWFNYFVWPRRCPECWTRRGWRVWLVEAGFAAVVLWLWQSPPEALGFWPALALLVYFGVVVVIDSEHRLILHPVSWVGAALGLAIGISLRGVLWTVVGGIAGYLIMLAFYWFGGVFARFMARRRGQVLLEDALGFGDVNLAGVIGLLLGWPGVIGGLILTILSAGIFSLIYIVVMLVLRRFRAFMAIPYGPFLVLGALILLFR
jgi:leader peptidase (prepilin peptidase)/N-methyltransferase